MNYIIEQILKQRKITDYLAKKGIFPEGGEANGKLRYKCPLHANDNTPSFFVYTNSKEFENFYCFGCKAKYHIIHLYRDMEKVTLSEAVKALASGMEFDLNAEISHIISDIENDKSIEARYTPVMLALQINRMMFNFLQEVDKDAGCCECVDKVSEIVDAAVERCDMDALEKMNDYLPDVLLKKMQQYMKDKEQKERENFLKINAANTEE